MNPWKHFCCSLRSIWLEAHRTVAPVTFSLFRAILCIQATIDKVLTLTLQSSRWLWDILISEILKEKLTKSFLDSFPRLAQSYADSIASTLYSSLLWSLPGWKWYHCGWMGTGGWRVIARLPHEGLQANRKQCSMLNLLEWHYKPNVLHRSRKRNRQLQRR